MVGEIDIIADRTTKKFEKLAELFLNKSRLLIVMQNNPDPDSIAAAMAVRKIAKSLTEVKCSIAHGGTVGRGENRALVRYLDINLLLCNEIEFDKFDLIAMVDAQPATGNTSLPLHIRPQIVIDHHPIRRLTRQSEFTDIRSRYGATSTILVEYLICGKIVPDTPLATALLYGIRSDTQDLGREATNADIRAIEYLYPFANKRMLSEIQRGSVPKEYFKMLSEAIKNAKLYGNSIITSLGCIDNPDMIGEVADLLLREDETAWTMCTGCFSDNFLISIRTCEQDARADKIIKYIVARRGTGGGHSTYAGGQIPLKKKKANELAKLKAIVEQKFLKTIGISSKEPQKLID